MTCSPAEVIHRLKSAASYRYGERRHCCRGGWVKSWGPVRHVLGWAPRVRWSRSWIYEAVFSLIFLLHQIDIHCNAMLVFAENSEWCIPAEERNQNERLISELSYCTRRAITVFIFLSRVAAYVGLIFHLVLFQHSSTYGADRSIYLFSSWMIKIQ